MKKVLLSLFLGTLLLGCQTKTENPMVVNPHQTGINLDSSANIDIVKKANQYAMNYATDDMKSLYADSAIVNDNLTKQSIAQNVEMLKGMQKAGITITMEPNPLIWEVVNDKADSLTHIKNYVITYYVFNFSKGTKKVKIQMNQAFACINGKIQQEWDTYDTAPLAELMK